MNRTLQILGISVLAAAAASAVAVLLVQDQIDRHQRNLFSPSPRRRLACLGHLAKSEATMDNITLLRDFVAREPRRVLRNRGKVILKRMETQAREDGMQGRGAGE